MAANPEIRYVGQWPDGTMKFAGPDGKVLPQGTTVSVQGNRRVFKNGAGQVIQVEKPTPKRNNVFAPVTSVDQLPAGSVDPALTYAMDAANRGIGYQDQDYNTNWAGFSQGADGTVARPGDLEAVNPDGTPKYGRGLKDYFTSFDRLNHQYDEQRDDTHTGYQTLGNNQLQSINAAGALGGGALAQALAKRTAHEAQDQSRISYARTGSLSDLLTNTTRGASDAYTGLTRGEGENAAYQGTLTTQAIQGAQGALGDTPGYEVINGVVYQRQPGGGVKPVAKKPKVPKPPKNPVTYAGIQHTGLEGLI